jgi:hypothetical protein
MSWRDRIASAIAGIKAFHSSPHDFERFDLSKIGTGEGAQSYGHGIYAAENPAVSGQGGQYWGQFLRRFPEQEQNIAGSLKAFGFDRNAVIDQLKYHNDVLQNTPSTAKLVGTGGAIDRAIANNQRDIELLRSGQIVGPRTYELNINAQPEQMLNWDAPLAQQSPYAQSVLEQLGSAQKNRPLLPTDTGRDVYYKQTQGIYNNSASQRLNDAGIPGIRYLDQGSRGRGYINGLVGQYGSKENALAAAQQKLAEAPNDFMRDSWQKTVDQLQRRDTSNYVIFDPGIIDITRKYGLAGAAPLGAGAMSSMFALDQYAPAETQQ